MTAAQGPVRLTMTPVDKQRATLAKRLAVRCGLARVAQLRGDQSGATTVEFAIVGLPFIALMLACLETALAFFAAQALDTAVGNSARLIRTGQAQEQGLTIDTFKDSICDQVYQLFNCAQGLQLDVKKFATFDSIDLARPLDVDGNLTIEDFGYEPGVGGDIVVVRAFYEWPVFINQLGNDLHNVTNGKHLIASIAAFKNEPFPW